MNKLKQDHLYELPTIKMRACKKLKKELLQKFTSADSLEDERYHHYVYNYLIYVNGREDIGGLNLIYDSSLIGTDTIMSTGVYRKNRPTVIYFNPDKKNFFSFKTFKDFFDVIDSMEHEMAHNYDSKYLSNPYKKFVVEQGRQPSIYRAYHQLFETIFQNSGVSGIAGLWIRLVYFSSHREQFARNVAHIQTKRFFQDMLRFALDENLDVKQIKKIVCGFEDYEKKVLADEQEYMKMSQEVFSGQGAVHGKSILHLKTEWDKIVDALCNDNLLSIEYMTPEKVEYINKYLKYVINICGFKTMYSQKNLDKLFDWQLAQKHLDLSNLMCIICQKQNKNSKAQITWLQQRLKGSSEEQKFYEACEKLFVKPEEKFLINPNIK